MIGNRPLDQFLNFAFPVGELLAPIRYRVVSGKTGPAAQWTEDSQVFWTGVDRLDQPDPDIGDTPQLYSIDAVAYESLMLVLFEIHLGPDNPIQQPARNENDEIRLFASAEGFA